MEIQQQLPQVLGSAGSSLRCSVCDTGGVGRGHAKQGCQNELMSWTKRPCDSFEPFVSTAQAAELQKLLDKGSQDSAFFCRLSQSEEQSDPVGSNRPFDSGRVSECMAESALRLLSTYVGAAHPLFPILLNFSFGQVSERQRPSLNASFAAGAWKSRNHVEEWKEKYAIECDRRRKPSTQFTVCQR